MKRPGMRVQKLEGMDQSTEEARKEERALMV